MKYKMGKPLAALMTASILFSSGASIYAEAEDVPVVQHATDVSSEENKTPEVSVTPKAEKPDETDAGEEKEKSTEETSGEENTSSGESSASTEEVNKEEKETVDKEQSEGKAEASTETEAADTTKIPEVTPTETESSEKKDEKKSEKTVRTAEDTETKESEEPETTPIDNSTTLADGEYKPDSFTFSGGSGKVTISCSKVIVAGGKATAVIQLSSAKYPELKANGMKYEGKCGNGVSEYTIPVQLDADNTIIGKTTAMSKVNWVTYTIHVTASADGLITDAPTPTPTPIPDTDYEDGDYNIAIESGYKMFKIASSSAKVEAGKILVTIVTGSTSYDKIYLGSKDDETKEPVIQGVLTEDGSGYVMTFELDKSLMGQSINFVPGKSDGTWYEKKQYTLTIPAALDKIEDKKDDDKKDDDKKDDDKKDDASSSEIKDGDYTINVTTSTGVMFKVVSAVLTNKNGTMTAKITLSGTGYDYLYIGTVGDAPNQKKNWVKYTLNGSGQYVFEIPVESLDKEIKLAAHSAKNDTWYERGIIFESLTMKAINISDSSNTPGTTPNTTPTPTPTQKPTNDKKPETESKYESDLSGGTGAVDSSTGLADGVYTPDKFSWSGGSGRTSISCTKVTVTGGQAYATIVFGSSNYGYVKANGNIYYPSYGGGTSTFTIPVKLNANNTIIGMTTAMSAAHEVTYSIFVYIAGADKAGTDSSELSKNDELSEKAPEIAGLEYVNEEKVEHAKYFKIYHYDQDISLIEIDLATDTDRPEDTETSEAETAAEEADETAVDTEEGSSEEAKDTTTIISDLYKNKVVKYLVVPEGAEIPVGLEKEVIVVNVPVESIYTDSEEAAAFLEKMDKKDLITLDGEEGTKPEYKEMILKKTDLAVLSDEFLWDEEDELSLDEQSELFYELTERLTTLDIPVLIDRSADEASEEASAEWIKIYEEILG